MTNRAVCYTTDKGYLFPSFVSATQARRLLSPGVAEILIVALDIDPATADIWRTPCEQEGIKLLPVSTAALDGASPYYARFFLSDLLPQEFDTFVYIDSDTQITGSIDPLLLYPLPPDRFLATTDPMVFALSGKDKLATNVMAHFTSLGLSSEQIGNYFNSGVLMSSRAVWQDIGRKAWSLARSQPGDTRFPDQDLLNLVAQGRNLPLSLAWNFPIYMKNLRVAESIRPRIVHYMSSPKPWSGVFSPWTQAEYDIYDAMICVYPQLAPYRKPMSPARQFRYRLQQWYKRVVESTGREARQKSILDYERTAVLNDNSMELLPNSSR